MPKLKISPKKLAMKSMISKVRKEMMWLRRNGLSLDNIGSVYKVSRQRVHQIIKGK